MERWKLLLAGKVWDKRETETEAEEGYNTDPSRHGARVTDAKKPKLGAKDGPRGTKPGGPPPPPRHHCVSTSKTHSSS